MNSLRRSIICATFFGVLHSQSRSSADITEIKLIDEKLQHGDWSFEIIEPGSYKLPDDSVVRMLWGAGHTGPKGGFLLNIRSGHVDIDMSGHSILIHYGVSAVGLIAGSNRELYKKFGSEIASNNFENVRLRNGIIDLLHGELTGPGIEFIDSWKYPDRQYLGKGDKSEHSNESPLNVVYLKNDYFFEELKVFSREIALAAEGTHTVIRNCVIESAGNAAIFIAGSNVLIENCDIRLRPLVESPDSYGAPLRAAIMLRDASNAIIRNNRIRVDRSGKNGDWPSDTRCIVVRDGATNVLIENNTFINVEGEWVSEMDGSKAISRGNKAERRWWPFG